LLGDEYIRGHAQDQTAQCRFPRNEAKVGHGGRARLDFAMIHKLLSCFFLPLLQGNDR
jgi:hypothetical protein